MLIQSISAIARERDSPERAMWWKRLRIVVAFGSGGVHRSPRNL